MSKLLAHQAVENNPLQEIAELKHRVAAAEDGTVNAAVLSDVSEDLGIVRSGIFVAGDGEPGDGESTNVFMAFPAIEFGAHAVNVGAQKLGSLSAGFNTDGDWIWGSGVAVANEFGTTYTGLTYTERFEATNAGISRRGEIGMFLPTGSSTPAWYFWFGDPTENTNLQEDGDIEAGNLGKFDAADSGSPTWAADSGSPYAGTYAALLTTTASGETNLQTNGDFEDGTSSGFTEAGTSSHGVNSINPHSGTYAISSLATANQTFSLTTNLGGTPRMAVTAGLMYEIALYTVTAVGSWYSTFTYAVKWYTATSGGSLISTDTANITAGTLAWNRDANTLLAPATAAGAEIVITVTRNASAGSVVLYLDDITFKPAQYGTLTTNLGGTPRMAVTAGNSYQFSVYAKTDTSGSGVWDTVKAEINWYTATSGGSLVSTSTVPISLGTSYANTAIPLTAPPTAAGATIVITAIRDSVTSYDSTVLAYFDDISLRSLTVSRYIKFLPNVTIEGGPLDFIELGSAPSTPASGTLSAYVDTGDNLRVVKDTGQSAIVSQGERFSAFSATISTAASTVFTYTLKANSLNTKGQISHWAKMLYLNNSGAARTLTFTYTFGSFTQADANYASLSASATNQHALRIEVTTYHNAATNAQVHQLTLYHMASVTAVAAGALRTWTPNAVWNTSAVDTTADITVSLTVVSSSNTGTQTMTGTSGADGPYNLS